MKNEAVFAISLESESSYVFTKSSAPTQATLCFCFTAFLLTSSADICRQPDAYHTNYVLAGLSSAQHKWNFNQLAFSQSQINLGSPFYWTSEKHRENQIFDEDDRVNAVHPVFVVPKDKAEAMRTYFQGRPL